MTMEQGHGQNWSQQTPSGEHLTNPWIISKSNENKGLISLGGSDESILEYTILTSSISKKRYLFIEDLMIEKEQRSLTASRQLIQKILEVMRIEEVDMIRFQAETELAQLNKAFRRISKESSASRALNWFTSRLGMPEVFLSSYSMTQRELERLGNLI